MPSTTCLGCEEQKRMKGDKFYFVDSIPNPLLVINNLRQTYNTKKRKLVEVSNIPPNSKVCQTCYKLSKKPCLSLPLSDQNEPDLTIYRKRINCHSRCTFNCKDIENLISVPNMIRHKLLMNYKFLAQYNARMCSKHVGITNYWPLVKQVSQEVSVEEQRIVSDLMYESYQELKNNDKLVFNIDKIDFMKDETFQAWFSYDKKEFQQICCFIKTCKSKHVAVFLCKLRTALSNNQLAFLFGVCEQTIANYINLAREDLHKNLVPKFINYNDRSVLVAHNTLMAKTLFDIPDNKTCSIFDATYRLAQKSKNYAGQKQLWSEQKKMPLVKPIVDCSPDGWVLFVLGPFDATHNDATILQDCFSRYSDEMNTIHEGDIILVDRGFRDVVNFLTSNKKLHVYCPGLGQLDTIEANASRFVTKCRWVIEQVFGRLKKKFKIFSLPAHNATLTNDYESLQIAFALLNLFHKPILSDTSYEDIAHIMKSRLNIPNRLKIVVQEFNLSQVKSPYLELKYTAIDNEENNQQLQFLQLTIDDLYYLSLGPYQIRNAISYYAEHQKEGIFLVRKFESNPRHPTAALDYTRYGISVENPLLVKAYMKSRYRGGKHHHIFVLMDKAKTGRDSITEYYCTCESGARTVGCCSHIMTIVWFLGYGQYHGINIPNPDICNVSITIKKQNQGN